MSELALKQQVETLYQQTAASSQEFCIDLEGEAPDGRHVWEWAHLSTVGNARRSVERKKQLIEGEHYLVIRSEIQVRHQPPPGADAINRHLALMAPAQVGQASTAAIASSPARQG